MKIVLTGGIASGKSTVADVLQEKGFAVLDADLVSREVSALPDVLEQIKHLFGAQFVVDGALDRKALRAYVFGNDERQKKLNALFHAKIYELLRERISAHEGDLVVCIPLYFECGVTLDEIDEIWTVSAPMDIRIQRVVLRDHTTVEQAQAILLAQTSDEEREARSHRVIRNGNDRNALEKEIERVLAECQWQKK